MRAPAVCTEQTTRLSKKNRHTTPYRFEFKIKNTPGPHFTHDQTVYIVERCLTGAHYSIHSGFTDRETLLF